MAYVLWFRTKYRFIVFGSLNRINKFETHTNFQKCFIQSGFFTAYIEYSTSISLECANKFALVTGQRICRQFLIEVVLKSDKLTKVDEAEWTLISKKRQFISMNTEL